MKWLCASFFLQVFGLLTPLFTQIVIDKVLVHKGFTTLHVLAIGMVALALFDVVLGGLRSYLFAHTSNRIDISLGAQLFRHLLALPLAYFEARRVGDTVARVRELENIRQFLTSNAVTVVLDVLFTVVFLLVMWFYSTTLMLAAYVRASFRATSLITVAGQIGSFIQKVTTIAVLWMGTYLVIGGELSIGQLIAFNMLSAQVTGPLLRLVNLWQEFQQVGISVQRLGDVLNTRPEPTYNPTRTTLPHLAGRVVFDQVTFRYRPDARPALRAVSFNVSPGEMIGIVGRSGSGKSTIAKLIQRLYVPERGRVLVDGVDLAQVDPTWLRRQVGVVLQENFLFNRSVRDNIALADPGVPMEQIIGAAKLAAAHDFILDLPEGYDTIVGEHGCSLSGGQRQRIAIARALIASPRILIFDEATSALDYESEAVIQQNMAQICQGRTVFIISHRLSTVRPAQRIYLLDKGELVEEGSHEELMKLNGLYARLHAHQDGRLAVV